MLEEARKRQGKLTEAQGSETATDNTLDESLEQVMVLANAANEAVRKQENTTKWTAALSKKYSAPENRKLRTISKEGNLSDIFKKEKDLDALQATLNTALDIDSKTPLTVKCNFKKTPLVIECFSGTKPPIILYKITQKPDNKFDIRMKKDLGKFAFKSKGKTVGVDYNAILSERDKLGIIGKILAREELALAVNKKSSAVVAPIPPAVKQDMAVALPAPVVEPKPAAMNAAPAIIAELKGRQQALALKAASHKEPGLPAKGPSATFPLQAQALATQKANTGSQARTTKPVEPPSELQRVFEARQARIDAAKKKP